MKKFFFLLAASAALVACDHVEKAKVASANTIDMDAAKKAIEASNVKFGNAAVAGDSAAIANLYHSEAQQFPPNMPMMNGRAGVAGYMSQMPKMGIKKVELKTDELLNGGDCLVERGTYDLGDGAKAIDKGKYMVVWKQEGGEWKMFRDIWNSDNPPPSSPAK